LREAQLILRARLGADSTSACVTRKDSQQNGSSAAKPITFGRSAARWVSLRSTHPARYTNVTRIENSKDRRTGGKFMKLRTLALSAVLFAAAVPSLASPASAAWRGHGWSSLAQYYPAEAAYYPPPYDNYGPVGPFVGYLDGYSDGHWHPAYWRYGHRGYRYAGWRW
jgi:hypothetical protein